MMEEGNFKNSTAPASLVGRLVIPDDILDLVRFFASLWKKHDALRWEALKLPNSEIKDFLFDKWPTVQGTSNILKLEQIAEQPYDEKRIAEAVKWMLEV